MLKQVNYGGANAELQAQSTKQTNERALLEIKKEFAQNQQQKALLE